MTSGMTPQQRDDLLRLRRLLADPNSDPLEIADCYVSLIGPQLRQLSREGLQRDGRGVIEIDLRGIDLRQATGTVPIAYYPADAGADDWPSDLYQVLATYDTRRETAVLLYQDRCQPLIYVLEE